MKKDFYKILQINNGKHYYNTQKLEKQDLWISETMNSRQKKFKCWSADENLRKV